MAGETRFATKTQLAVSSRQTPVRKHVKLFDLTASERDSKNKTETVTKTLSLQKVCVKLQFCLFRHQFLLCFCFVRLVEIRLKQHLSYNDKSFNLGIILRLYKS
ncbi:hypothetical protein NQ317_002552 [Molorchus minor]|uniref:Uncharacterized protein n=1 Tax=Molorchus minor TaxID=1323400 RepID=A0ABQ9JSA3_9CUCU|nr:hypothetical protein NQ317_002552 [Molorchus minor]